MELRNSLTSKYGIELPPTAIFDYPTVKALAGFVVGKQVFQAQPASSEEDGEDDNDPATDTRPSLVDTEAVKYEAAFIFSELALCAISSRLLAKDLPVSV